MTFPMNYKNRDSSPELTGPYFGRCVHLKILQKLKNIVFLKKHMYRVHFKILIENRTNLKDNWVTLTFGLIL